MNRLTKESDKKVVIYSHQTKKLKRRRFIKVIGLLAAALGLSSLKKTTVITANPEKQLSCLVYKHSCIGPKSIAKFQRLTNVQLRIAEYSAPKSISEFLHQLADFDVLILPKRQVTEITKHNLLTQLDEGRLSNLSNIFPQFLKPDESGSNKRYSIAHCWGTIGIGYNTMQVNMKPNSWRYLYDSSYSQGYISLFNNPHYLIRIGLKLMGYSVNDSNPKRLKQVVRMLIDQKRYLQSFHRGNGKELLLAGNAYLVQEMSGSIAQISDLGFDYLIPKEGSIIWQNDFALPKNSQKLKEGYQLLNFLLSKEAAAETALLSKYGTPNRLAYNSLPKEYTKNSIIFPKASLLAKCEQLIPLGIEYDNLLKQLLEEIKMA